MAENNQSQEKEIPIPKFEGNPGEPLSDDALAGMQDQFLTDMKEKVTANGSQKKTEAKSDGKKSKKAAKTDPQTEGSDLSQMAENFSQKAKEVQKTGSEEESGEEGEGDDFAAPKMPDMSQFLDPDNEEESSQEEQEEGEEELDEEEEGSQATDNKTENIKNLRTSNKELKSRVTQLEAELKNRPDANGLQKTVQELRDRVKQLEPYELVFGLHNNPQFKAQFIDGANNLVTEMNDIAKDYGLEAEVVDEILATSNRKDLDEIISENFPSDESRREMKTLKKKYDGLLSQRRKAEQAPESALQDFYKQEQETEAVKNSKRDTHFKQVATSAWSQALSQNSQLPEEQRIGELMEVPGMKDHNNKVVRPTLQAANDLVSVGLQHIEKMIRGQNLIDDKFATWFAGVCQQATAAQMIHNTRQGLYQEYQKLQNQHKEGRKFSRPSVNTASRDTPTKKSKKKMDGRETAAQIFMDVQKETTA